MGFFFANSTLFFGFLEKLFYFHFILCVDDFSLKMIIFLNIKKDFFNRLIYKPTCTKKKKKILGMIKRHRFWRILWSQKALIYMNEILTMCTLRMTSYEFVGEWWLVWNKVWVKNYQADMYKIFNISIENSKWWNNLEATM